MGDNGLANPAPLGLMGFGMTTVLLNLHNAGLFELGSMILAMGIFYGGIAQVIAGVLEFKNANTFGTTAFCSFGLFWLSFVFLIVFPEVGWGRTPSNIAIASYLFLWGLFTLGMFFGTLKTNRALQFVFMSLAILFFLLSTAYAFDSSNIIKVAGYEGIICGFSAIYLALALVINEAHGKTILPILPIKKS